MMRSLRDGEFHLDNGLVFRRHPEGRVEIRQLHPNGGDSFVCETSASGWASVVAHLSARGESAETHAAALALHDGVRTTLPASTEGER